jgi:hypothetical protein
LDVIPSTLDLSGAGMSSEPGREYILKINREI